MVLNKPMGLAVQGGSGTTRHIDGMLGALRGPDGQRPRLVHRLDKDTAGCLLVAKTRFAAAALAKTFRSRSARKIYWALVAGVPKPAQGRISTYLAKQEVEEDSIHAHRQAWREGCSPCRHLLRSGGDGCATTCLAFAETGDRAHSPVARAYGAHSVTRLSGIRNISTRRTGNFPAGYRTGCILLARRIAVPHPRGGMIDVSAPLPPHMEQSWNLLGFDAKRYDPIEEAPEE